MFGVMNVTSNTLIEVDPRAGSLTVTMKRFQNYFVNETVELDIGNCTYEALSKFEIRDKEAA